MQKIKSKDTVIILTGKDKGKTGEVIKVISPKQQSRKAKRVLVAGINMIKKHVRGNPQQGEPGGIIEREASIDISNVAIFNPTTQKADRVAFKMEADNRKVRVFKSSGEVINVVA